mmetsp:Transcript_68070/g.129561  ORF Transcript_68070/g.129561 Transcript_68070/m.129561 type:complete len:565 (+) Transcript_68070:67-1761(+)
MSMSLLMCSTPEAFDDLLENMEDAFCELEAAQVNVVHLPEAELNLLEELEVACNFMNRILQLPEGTGDLEKVFGQDCARISRIRAVLDAAQLSDTNAHDERFQACSSACEAVEKLLQARGLAFTLRRTQQRKRTILQKKGSLSARCSGNSPCSEPGTVTVIDLLGERESFLKQNAETEDSDSTPAERNVQTAAVSIPVEEPEKVNRSPSKTVTFEAAKDVDSQQVETASPKPLLRLALMKRSPSKTVTFEAAKDVDTQQVEKASPEPPLRRAPMLPQPLPIGSSPQTYAESSRGLPQPSSPLSGAGAKQQVALDPTSSKLVADQMLRWQVKDGHDDPTSSKPVADQMLQWQIKDPTSSKPVRAKDDSEPLMSAQRADKKMKTYAHSIDVGRHDDVQIPAKGPTLLGRLASPSPKDAETSVEVLPSTKASHLATAIPQSTDVLGTSRGSGAIASTAPTMTTSSMTSPRAATNLKGPPTPTVQPRSGLPTGVQLPPPSISRRQSRILTPVQSSPHVAPVYRSPMQPSRTVMAGQCMAPPPQVQVMRSGGSLTQPTAKGTPRFLSAQ